MAIKRLHKNVVSVIICFSYNLLQQMEEMICYNIPCTSYNDL